MKRRCADEWASRHPRRRVEDLSGTSQEQSVCGRRKWASSRLAATAALKLFLYSYFLQPPSDVAQNIHSFSLKCICMLIMYLICYIDLVHMKQYHAGCAVFFHVALFMHQIFGGCFMSCCFMSFSCQEHHIFKM